MRLLETPERNTAKHPHYDYQGEKTRDAVAAVSHIANFKPFHTIHDYVKIFIFKKLIYTNVSPIFL